MAYRIIIMRDTTELAAYTLKGSNAVGGARLKKFAALVGIAVDGVPLVDADGVPQPGTPMTAAQIADGILAYWVEDAKRVLTASDLDAAVAVARETARAQAASDNDL